MIITEKEIYHLVVSLVCFIIIVLLMVICFMLYGGEDITEYNNKQPSYIEKN